MNHDPYNMEDINDIVLNRNGNDRSANIKKILTAIAILIILFLIVLIIMKFINRGNIDTTANLQMPSETELAKKEQQPKLKQVVISQKDEPKKPEPKQVEPEVEPKKPEPKIEPKPEADNKFEIKKVEPIQPKEQIIEIKKEEPKEQIVAKNEPKNVEQPKVEPKPEPKKVEPVKKEEPKVEIKKPEPKPEPKKEQPKVEPKKPEPKKEQPKAEPKKPEPKKEEPKKSEPAKQKSGTPQNVGSLASGNYVQVHALSQYNPNANSVKKIFEKGYTPVAYKSGNLTRLLVGPFKNNDELNRALSDLRTLNSEAFVYRVK